MGSQGLGVIPRHDSIHGDVPVRLAIIRKWRRIEASLGHDVAEKNAATSGYSQSYWQR
jgi:hypothetical protein